MHGNPAFKNDLNEIGYPFDVLTPAVIRFAPAPVSVPFPPKQAPKAIVQANVTMSKSNDKSFFIVFRTGMIVATKVTLSRMEEISPDAHNKIVCVKKDLYAGGMLVMSFTSTSPMAWITPSWLMPSMKMKSPA